MSLRFPKHRGKHAKRPIGVFVTFSVLVSSLFVSPLLIPDQEAEATSIEQDYAISFDGVDDYAMTGENWLGISGPPKLTVSLWAKYDDASPSGNDTIFRLGYNFTSRTSLYIDDGDLKFVAHAKSNTLAVNLNFSPTLGAWHHYAMVYDEGATQDYSIYVDGNLVGNYGAADITFATTGANSKFYFAGYGADYFEGQLDEIKVYRDARTDISQLMHEYSTETYSSASLRAYWPFNGQNAENAGDISGSQFNLTLVSSPTYSLVAQFATSGSDTIVTFPRSYLTSDGGWIVPAGVSQVRSLVVAGGGGGGAHVGGGGGAGGFIETTSESVTSGSTKMVKIGAGGLGSAFPYNASSNAYCNNTSVTNLERCFRATNGQGSQFSSVVTTGGGSGGSWNYDAPRTGGSGGGSGGPINSSAGAAGVSGQGNKGGNYAGNSETFGYASGGGGGAGGLGENGTLSASGPGNGGPGKNSDIRQIGGEYFAGGGGAGQHSNVNYLGTGGLGGGGDGAKYSNVRIDSQNGEPNTGGGGGGGGRPNDAASFGGHGGSGVVILRYTTPVVPGTVQNFSAETRLVDDDSDTDSVTLNWDELTGQTPAVTGYLVEYNKDNDFSTANSSTFVSGGGTTTTTITGLDDGDTYYFRIKARNVIGDSASGPTAISRAISKTDSALDTSDQFASSSSTIIPTSTSADFSIEMWVRLTDISGHQALISQGDNDRTFYLKNHDGVVKVHQNGVEVSSAGRFIQNAWHHIALTVDESNRIDGSKMYFDGALVGEFSGARQAFSTTGSKGLHIGALSRDDGNPTLGEVDQVKIWSDVLTPEEIVQSMHSWSDDADYDGSADIDNLIAHYDFNDNTQAATLRDMKGQNDLSITGASTTDFKQDSILNEPTRTGYQVYEFKRTYLTANGGWTPPNSLSQVEALVVGAGGAGGFARQHSAGGGGGGQVSSASGISISSSTVVKVLVGQGGTSLADSTFSASLLPSGGQRSSLNYGDSLIEAKGGGPGSSGNGTIPFAIDLGSQSDFHSGGGASAQANAAERYGDPGTATTNGGSAAWHGGDANKQSGGGGGGAGADGEDGSATSAGAGGVGKSSPIISGTALFYGGGGGGGKRSSGTAGAGGSSVGGAGGVESPGASAEPNSGGGGGGAGDNGTGELGGNGGSGLVVLAFETANITTTSPSDQTSLSTQAATFSISTVGSSGTLSYQWQVDSGSGFADIAGATSASYTTPVLQTSDNGNQYRVVVTSSLNGTTSTTTTSAATLTVNNIFTETLVLDYNASDINSFDTTVSTTAVTDRVGNYDGEILTISGNAVSVTNQTFRFDGSESFIDIADIPDSVSFAEGITIDFMADFGEKNSWERILDFGNGESTDNIIVAREGMTDNLAFEIYDSASGVDYTSIRFRDQAGLDGLNRFTIVANGTNTNLYVNGTLFSGTKTVLESGGGENNLPKAASRANNFVGESNWAGDSIFEGEIRHIRIFNNAFQADQMNNIAVSYETVTFNANYTGGTDPASLITAGEIRLPSVSRTGHTLLGWYTDATGGTKQGDPGDAYDPGDTSLHAQWQANSYNITWDANSGTLAGDEASTFNTGGSIAEPSDPSRTGFDFMGWSTSETSNNGDTGNKITSWPYSPGVTSDITLYAIWQSSISITTPTTGLSGTFGEAFSLSIATSGGTGSNTFSATGLGSGLSIDSSTGVISGTPTATGNQTVAVTVTDSGGNSATTSNFTISIATKTLANSSAPTVADPAGQRKTLSVSWQSVANASSYTLRIYDSSDALLETITGLSGTSKTVTSADFAAIEDNTAYKFSIQAVGTGNYVSNAESALSTAAKTFRVPKIFFNENYGANTTTSTVYETGDLVTLPSPTRTGFVLQHWMDINDVNVGAAGADYSPLTNDELILRYEFDDSDSYSGVGTSVNDISSTVNPSVTGNIAGTFEGDTSFSSENGGYVSFDGNGDYIRTGDLRARDGGTNSAVAGPVSIFAWIYPQSENGVIVMESGQTTLGVEASWHDSQIEMVGGKLEFNTWGYATDNPTTTNKLPLNQWYYVGLSQSSNQLSAFVIDESGSSVAMTNGTIEKSRTVPDVNQQGLTYAIGHKDYTNLGSGALLAPDENWGKFRLGAFHVYNKGLSSAEVTRNYQATCARFHVDSANCTGQTLRANWTAAAYTITFEAGDNGAGSAQTDSKSHGTDLTLPNSATANGWFTREGYTVTSWSTNSDGSTSDFAFGEAYTANAVETLYPVWTPNNNTVTFDANTGSGTMNDQTIVTDQATNLSANSFNKTGYDFSGWSTAADGSGTSYSAGQSVTLKADLDLFAQWTPGTYTVTYDYNSATGGNTRTDDDFTTDGVAITLPVPTRTGYTFDGWFEESDFSGTKLGVTYTTDADVTIYAKWSANTYTVLYEYNGRDGGDSDSSDSYTTGSTSITLPVPTRTGNTFAGWHENADLSDASDVSSPYTTSVNRTLYAGWSAIDYALSYNANNGTGSLPASSVNYNYQDSVGILGPGGLTRTGYSFVGWTQAADGSGTVYTSGDTLSMPAQAVTLYAKWSANTYTITYHKNGAAGALAKATDSYITNGSNVTLPGVGTMSKTGYDFDGWSPTPTGSKLPDSYSTTEDVTLYARWVLKDITYSYARGVASGTNVLDAMLGGASLPTGATAKYGSSVTLSNALSGVEIDALAGAEVDHEFFGWSDGSGTLQPGDSYVLGETNPTFTAQWAKLFQVNYAFGGGTAATGEGQFDSECTNGDNTCSDGQGITLNAAPSRAGYDFTGWEDQSGNSYSAGGSMTVDADSFLLYAQWSAIDYFFSFNSNGGSATTANKTQNIGDLIVMPSPGTRDGYTFDGWDDGSNKYPTGSTFLVGTAGASFTASWIPDVYTVSYDWQGGTGTPEANDSFTVGTGPMTLPSQGDRVKDGFEFAGWSETPGGSVLSDYEPDSDQVLYAVWSSGNYTLNFDAKGGTVSVSSALVPRTESRNLPTPSRAGFVFTGWFDSASGGNKLGNAGATFTPSASDTLYARWVQRSLFGVDEASLANSTATMTADNSSEQTGSITSGSTSASVVVPAGSLEAGTVVRAQFFKDTVRQSSLIPGENSYFFSALVSWLKGSGDTATVPDTAGDKPVEVTLTSSLIKEGASIYQIIGDQVTDLGVATQDGTVTVELFEDPEIVIAATKPDAPTGAGAVAADTEATVSWTAPANNGGAEITQYTVTSTPGSFTCVTATTSCDVTGLTNGTAYTFSVTATNSVGTSSAVQTSSVTPALTSYTVTFNSNGGSSVGSGSFISGGSISEPTEPTRSGFTFGGWSTTKDDASTKVSFPYSPGVDQNITLFALWTAVSSGGSSGGSGGGSSEPAAPVTPENSEIGFIPELPETPVSETGPVVEIIGETVEIDTDSSNENLVAAGAGWQVKVQSKTESGSVKPVSSELKVSFEYSSAARFSGSGLQANTVLEAWVFSEPTYLGQVSVDASGNLDSVIELPESLLPGEHTLQLGTVTATGKLAKISIPIIVEGKVTVGTFKGYIAIYTKFLEGERLSARVAGRWLVQDPIDTFKDFGYSRVVRFTGAGYDILVDLYINREFYKRVTTRTR